MARRKRRVRSCKTTAKGLRSATKRLNRAKAKLKRVRRALSSR